MEIQVAQSVQKGGIVNVTDNALKPGKEAGGSKIEKGHQSIGSLQGRQHGGK